MHRYGDIEEGRQEQSQSMVDQEAPPGPLSGSSGGRLHLIDTHSMACDMMGKESNGISQMDRDMRFVNGQ